MARLFSRGWFGEQRTAWGLWLWLGSANYRSYHDLILPSANGTAQIDHLVVSPFGLFVIETKNKSGWIFGSERQRTWTQVLYHEKYTFQNPLHQAWRQKKVLAEFLDLPMAAIETVVHVNGGAEFKTPMPANVLTSGLARYIRGFRERRLTPDAVREIRDRLDRHRSTSTLTHRDHLRSLHERHGSTTVCPRCGSPLVVRVARRGHNAGQRFLGCTAYPRCRYARSLG